PSRKAEPVCPTAARMLFPSCRQPKNAFSTVSEAAGDSELNQPRLAWPWVSAKVHQPEALRGDSKSRRTELRATLSANHEMARSLTVPPISPGAQPAEAR